jgi:hypothetical protein
VERGAVFGTKSAAVWLTKHSRGQYLLNLGVALSGGETVARLKPPCHGPQSHHAARHAVTMGSALPAHAYPTDPGVFGSPAVTTRVPFLTKRARRDAAAVPYRRDPS